MRAGDECLAQVLRVVDDRFDEQPFGSVLRQPIEIFRQHGVFAVRDAILPQIARLELRGYYLECRAGTGRRRREAAALASSLNELLPFGLRVTLPRSLGRWNFRLIEMQQPRLKTGVGFD